MPTLGTTPQTDTIQGPLAIGSRGKDVQSLQSLLNDELEPSPGLAEDGAFGAKTDAAVRRFQQENSLKADGIVGPLTAKALGVKFLFLPAPKPQPKLPGQPTPTSPSRASLFATITAGLRNIVNAADREILIQEVSVNIAGVPFFAIARTEVLSGLNQAQLLLNIASADVVDAQFASTQTRTALLLMFSALIRASTDLQASPGGNGIGLIRIASALSAVTPQVAEIVRVALEGGLTIDAASRQVFTLLNSAAV